MDQYQGRACRSHHHHGLFVFPHAKVRHRGLCCRLAALSADCCRPTINYHRAPACRAVACAHSLQRRCLPSCLAYRTPRALRSLRRPTQRVVDVAAGGAGYNEYVAIQPCALPLACYDTPITGLFLTVMHSCAAVQVPREACCSPRGAQSGHENEADCERIISRQPLRCDRQHGEVLLSVTRTLQTHLER